MITRAKKLIARAGKAMRAAPQTAPLFEKMNQTRFHKKKGGGRSLILASQYDFPATIYVNSFLVNKLADRYDAQAGSFSLEPQIDRSVDRNYRSFGCPLLFSLKKTRGLAGEAGIWARLQRKQIKTKWDLLGLELEGINTGMVIYDSYVRYFNRPTVDFSDPRLWDVAANTYQIFYSCLRFLDRHDLKALIPDHMVYSKGGVISAIAWARDIPIFTYSAYQPFYITKVARRSLAPQALKVPFQLPFDRYTDLFGRMSPADQENARAKSEEALKKHLAGLRTDIIFGNRSAYAEPDGKKVLSESSKPKILVMLHDFCDAPHCYGDLLFPDFYEWIRFLLSRAVETNFEWYVKPHPNLEHHSNSVMGLTNRKVIEELKTQFPSIRFLPPATSNRQIIQEGVSALFTVYGTAGHEFAYLGVPVVNAGTNPHVCYDFNFHPASIAEYEEFIAKADKLKKPDYRSDVERFYYMYTFYLGDQFNGGFEIVPDKILNHADRESLVAHKDMLDQLVQNESPGFAQKMDQYLDYAIDKSLALLS